MKRALVLAIGLLILTALACRRGTLLGAQRQPASTTTVEQLSSGGVTRTYRLHLPAGYQPGTAYPLVLNFHGFTSNAQEEEDLTGMSAKADSAGFIVVYPEGLNKRWNTGPGPDGDADRQFVRDLIAALSEKYTIDPKRIYATGLSNGGGMTDRLGCEMSDIIAAIAPDSGAYNFWQDCSPSRPVPVLAFHGLDDKVVPYTGGTPRAMEPPIEEWAAAWAARDGCEAAPSLTTPVEGVTVRTWGNCQEGAQVILYTLANHGHSWPGSPTMPRAITSEAVNATDLMWDFFQAHPLP
jgi:polyhydroxybutyrate depolymerase